jgi:glycine/D-amino acid oxidase-like deaminating enzyme
MELTSDFPFWSIRNGLPSSYPRLDHDLDCEVAIIGGGITGALVGYHLAEAGVKTVLLDKRDIGTGSTSGSTGLLQYEVDTPLRELKQRVGWKNAARSYQLCGEAVTKLGALAGKLKIECQFEPRPSLFMARSADEIGELREEMELRRAIGFEVDLWSEARIKKEFGFSRPAALFSQLGGEVDPHALAHGLLAAAERRGLKIFDRTPVTKFLPTARGINLETDRGVKINARRVVMAAGFESLRYTSGEAGELMSTYALVSEPLADLGSWHRRSLIWESGTPYLYLRTTADRRVIVGGEDVDLVNPSKRDALIGQKTKTLLRKFAKLFPDLKLEVAYAWAGTFGGTKDGLAYIGFNSGLKHTYFALGYGGNGITYSLIAAEIIRDDFLGRKNPDARIFRFGR